MMTKNNKSELPIGVFDSGVGGISVLRELVKQMPEENFIYFGDSKNAPYGTKTLKEVQYLTGEDAKYLINQGVKALVVACNTATSAAIKILRKEYADMPIIGIEPALKPAVMALEHPRVLVLATPMTLKEEKFMQLLEEHKTEAQIIPLACPGLVEFVERGELSSSELENYLIELFAEYTNHPVDCVVLGCTHYPFVKEMIQKVLGNRVQLFDGGAGTARETHRRLMEQGIENPSHQSGRVLFQNSLPTEEMMALCESLLKS